MYAIIFGFSILYLKRHKQIAILGRFGNVFLQLMSRRLLIVPDKFKGSLTALQAADSIAVGWRAAWPGDTVELLPMSDGGDGFGEVMAAALGMAAKPFPSMDAAGRARTVSCWLDAYGGQAVIETAQSNGLALLQEGQYHPFVLDTLGVGQLLMQLGQAGVKRCLSGIGGSATNDAGFGMARALGWKFIAGDGREITRWTELAELKIIEKPEPSAWPSLTVASDVTNPLLGPNGATRIYGPQKGMREEDFSMADACFEHLAKLTAETIGTDFAVAPGAGAAGGLGFGLIAFAGAELRSGFDVFNEATKLESKIARADLVITAEGSIDEQTLMGKGTGQVAQLCRRLAKPCLGLAGQLALGKVREDSEANPFSRLVSVVPEVASEAESMANAADCLGRLANRLAKEFPLS